MTATGDLLGQVVPTLVRVARRPGGVLLRVAGAGVAVFTLLALVLGLTGSGWGAWVPLALAGALGVPVVVLAVRRERLQAQTADLHLHRTIGASSRDLVVVGGVEPSPVQQELDALSAAMAEGAVRTARFLPRVEAAQRAALRAAGGPVQAPYLRDDLRVTIVALLGTVGAVPLSVLGSVVTAVLLLAR
ncbi:hypothetical protein [Georgenia sp. SYP-B2076]|uniref:hypothetical protein n=1 Tax=Georgenia sp. SYP-B2076 TaxID=2495881 RepID=UPI000F8DCBD0|nr:hypothetical protein [Georgenia sp. SYP-B2076]